MKKKKITALAICLLLGVCAMMTLVGCDSDKERPKMPPPGAVSGGAAGFKPDGTPPADFKPDGDWEPPDGDFQPPDGEKPDGTPPADFKPDGDWQPPDGEPKSE